MRLHDAGGSRHPQGVSAAGLVPVARGESDFPCVSVFGAQTRDVAGVWGDFRLEEDDVERGRHAKTALLCHRLPVGQGHARVHSLFRLR